jgi:two-component sensor histidine kinase
LLRGAAVETDLDIAELMISELVTNAVLHGMPRRRIRITLTVADDTLLVEVSNRRRRGTMRAIAAAAVDDSQESGRGLVLVEALTEFWNARETRSRTFVSAGLKAAVHTRNPVGARPWWRSVSQRAVA